LFSLGEIYYTNKSYQKSQEMLEKALVLNPRRSSGYMLLMKDYLHLSEFEAANGILKRAEGCLDAGSISQLRHALGEPR